MKYRVRFLPEMAVDLTEIVDYLGQYYSGTVSKFLTLLEEKVARLKEFPYSCAAYEDDPDYRKMVVGDYLLFYMVNEDEKAVEIHRIFHGAKDIRRHLN